MATIDSDISVINMKLKNNKSKQTRNKKNIIKETEELEVKVNSIKRMKRKIKFNKENMLGMIDEIEEKKTDLRMS